MITLTIQSKCLVFLKASLIALLLNASWGQAQTQWPSKAVTLVVPFAPGGGTDIGSRIVAQKLSLLWGQSVLVDNRGGAGGNLGLEIVSRAKPDGYTLLTGNVGTQSINPTLYKKLNYNPDTSFAPIGLFAELPFVFAVTPSLPANSVKELVALAKASPDKLTYARVNVSTSRTAMRISDEFGAPSGDRTQDLRIKSPLLYQLS